MIISCPEKFSSTIISLVTQLSFHLQNRLVEQWSIVKLTQTTDDYEPSEEELIAESTMSLLSRFFFKINYILIFF
jgi:hypothetical protein